MTIARGSLVEVHTQLVIAHRVGYLSDGALDTARQDVETLSRMLLSFMRSLERRASNH